MTHFNKVKNYLSDLGFSIQSEDPSEELVIISDESRGIKNLIIDCEDPILILEQHIFKIKAENVTMLKRLLQLNRELVHGAFVIDETGNQVLWRDTLQLENLDLNELEGSIKALELGLAENSSEIIRFARS